MLLNFDSRQVEPRQSVEPLPAGWYVMQITASEEVPVNGKPDCSRLKLELTCIDGTYKGRKAWDGLNLRRPDDKAKQIAYETLSSICRATGVIAPGPSSDLHMRPMLVRLVLTPAQMDDKGAELYALKNEVKDYKAIDGATAAPGAGIAGNAAGVPDWAGAAASAQPAATTSPLTTVAGGGLAPLGSWAQPPKV